MNVAYLLQPKQNVSFLFEDFSVRQALEKMRRSGYTAIPVVTRDGKYIGTVSEGDFLWFFVDKKNEIDEFSNRTLESMSLKDVSFRTNYNPVTITANPEELINVALRQNFIPVVDDIGSFVGIVTRKAIIERLLEDRDK